MFQLDPDYECYIYIQFPEGIVLNKYLGVSVDLNL